MASVSPERALAAILRGHVDNGLGPDADADAILAAAREHDVVSLLAERLASLPSVDAGLRAQLREESQRLAAADLAAEIELRRVLATLHARGVQALLIKGSHLAYTHYARPDLRARLDSDVLVSLAQRDPACRVLDDLGYTADAKLSGELTATQQLYVLYRHSVPVHLIDLHWRLASPQVFAHVLSFEELHTASRPIPALSPVARGPSDVHALVIACMHRVAHHHDEPETLKWIYDIHIIASRFQRRDWDAFVSLVAERRVGAVCRDGLLRAAQWFDTPVPDDVVHDPRLQDDANEVTSAYLDERTQASAVLADLRSLPTWRLRARLAREHLVPSADYMRRVYAPGSRLPLSILYGLRIARGAGAWMTRRSRNDGRRVT